MARTQDMKWIPEDFKGGLPAACFGNGMTSRRIFLISVRSNRWILVKPGRLLTKVLEVTACHVLQRFQNLEVSGF